MPVLVGRTAAHLDNTVLCTRGLINGVGGPLIKFGRPPDSTPALRGRKEEKGRKGRKERRGKKKRVSQKYRRNADQSAETRISDFLWGAHGRAHG